MKVIFLTTILTYTLMKPPWCSLLIRVFPISDQGSWRSFHRRPIKHKGRHKLNRGPIRPRGVGGPRYAYPENVEIVRCQRCNFMHFGGQGNTENELFMIIKLDEAKVWLFLK